MLAQRVVTALVLLALLLPALFASAAWPFDLLTLVLIAAAGWEWARLNGGASLACLVFGVLLACACLAALAFGWTARAPIFIWWIATLLWVLGGAWALQAGPAEWPAMPLPGRWALGFLALWTAWLALASSRVVGINFILSIFGLVWAADIAAYFGGRAFGKRKLAVSISPGKSWEGVWSGIVGVMVLAFAWTAFDRSGHGDSSSFYTRLVDAHGIVGFTLVLIFLSAMSVVGDLVESLVKRSAGAKDSSGLLPGHGGVLDRVDALLPVFPLALAIISLK